MCVLVSNNSTIIDGEEQPVLRAAEQVVLAPFTEQLVSAVGNGQAGMNYLVDNGQEMIREGLFVGRQVIIAK